MIAARVDRTGGGQRILHPIALVSLGTLEMGGISTDHRQFGYDGGILTTECE